MQRLYSCPHTPMLLSLNPGPGPPTPSGKISQSTVAASNDDNHCNKVNGVKADDHSVNSTSAKDGSSKGKFFKPIAGGVGRTEDNPVIHDFMLVHMI